MPSCQQGSDCVDLRAGKLMLMGDDILQNLDSNYSTHLNAADADAERTSVCSIQAFDVSSGAADAPCLRCIKPSSLKILGRSAGISRCDANSVLTTHLRMSTVGVRCRSM